MKKIFSLTALLLSSAAFCQNVSPSALSYLNLLFPNIVSHNQMAEININQTILDTASLLHFNTDANGHYTSGYEIDYSFNDTVFWLCSATGNFNQVAILNPNATNDTLLLEDIYKNPQGQDTLIVTHADTGGTGITKYQDLTVTYGSNGFTELIMYLYNNGTREEFLKFTPTYDGNGQLQEVAISVSFGGINLPVQSFRYDYQGLALQNVYVIESMNNDTVEIIKPILNPAYEINRLNFMQQDSADEWVVYNIMDFSNQSTAVGLDPSPMPAISFFPNPVRDVLQVRSLHNTQIFVYSMKGELVYSGKATPTSHINLTALAPGVYILRTQGDRGMQSFKFIKE